MVNQAKLDALRPAINQDLESGSAGGLGMNAIKAEARRRFEEDKTRRALAAIFLYGPRVGRYSP